MGNVLAAAPLNPPVPVPPEEPSGNGKNRKNNRNPGSVEDLHKKCKGMLVVSVVMIFVDNDIYFT